MTYIILAALLFVGTHLGISSTGLRARLVGAIGERGFLALYSLIAIATLSYLIVLYNELPRYDYLWMPSPERYMAAKVLMPIAMILAIGGFLVKNPTMVGGDALLESARGEDFASGEELARGVTRITRHPFQWGVLLWAIAHLIANGDVNSVVFFSAFALLAGLGTWAMDRKKAQTLGEAWAAYAGVTSNLPFAAVISGRNRLVISELWLPVLLGLIGYGILVWRHEWVSGVRIL